MWDVGGPNSLLMHSITGCRCFNKCFENVPHFFQDNFFKQFASWRRVSLAVNVCILAVSKARGAL